MTHGMDIIIPLGSDPLTLALTRILYHDLPLQVFYIKSIFNATLVELWNLDQILSISSHFHFPLERHIPHLDRIPIAVSCPEPGCYLRAKKLQSITVPDV